MADNAIIHVLQKARALGASDVHIAPNEVAAIRLHGRITRPWPEQKVFGDQIRGFVSDTLDEETRVRLHNDGAASASLDGDELDTLIAGKPLPVEAPVPASPASPVTQEVTSFARTDKPIPPARKSMKISSFAPM